MKNSVLEPGAAVATSFISTQDQFEHWQGHRRVTRRTIEAFPEDKLFTYSIGGMRPFSELILEMVGMAVPGIEGVATGKWEAFKDAEKPASKEELLALWDSVTADLNRLWPEVPAHRFAERDLAFGQYENPNYETILYFIDNEIHHRGQGYVYLRSLGIQPPDFWNRD